MPSLIKLESELSADLSYTNATNRRLFKEVPWYRAILGRRRRRHVVEEDLDDEDVKLSTEPTSPDDGGDERSYRPRGRGRCLRALFPLP